MKGDLFTNLPEQMMREILGRIPIKSLIRCKCVRKSWHDLIDEPEFKSSYSPKPCFAFSYEDMYIIYDDDTCELLFRFWMNPAGRLYFGKSVRYSVVIDSVDGLLMAKDGAANILFVCNPIIREYVGLPRLYTHGRRSIFGFGVSRISGQYKVLNGEVISGSYHVYTLGGEGSWRSISSAAPGNPILLYNNAIFCNENLHWLVSYFDFEEKYMVCCFDLDTELFTSFSIPHYVYESDIHSKYRLCILEGRLCLYDYLCGCSNSVVIWWMNKYGDENSWVKEYTFHLPEDTDGPVFPLKVLENGDLLFTMNFRCRLFIYSKRTKDVMTVSHVHLSTSVYYNIATYTPSFLSLKAMGIHNVQSLNLYS